MNTKDKGDIAELRVMGYLIKNGYTVLKPFGDNARFDVVSYKDQKFERIQIKYVSLRNGCIKVPNYSCVRKNKKHVKQSYNNKEIDCIIVYCPQTNGLYKINIKSLKNKQEMILRVLDTKNNQVKKINTAKNYQLMDV